MGLGNMPDTHLLNRASLAKYLRESMSGDAVLCIYYFRFDDAKRRTFREFIKSVILQCALADMDYATRLLKPLFVDHGHGSCEPRLDALLAVLERLLRHCRQCYLVVDALDECTDTHLLCEWISDVQRWRFDTVHLFLTSRVFPHLQATLQNLRFTDIEFDNDEVDKDIARHIERVLRDDTKLSALSGDLKHEIKTRLVEGGNGMSVPCISGHRT